MTRDYWKQEGWQSVMAMTLRLLERFAVLLPIDEDAREYEAERFLRFTYKLEPDEWEEIARFRDENPEDLDAANTLPPGVYPLAAQISGIVSQVRNLFAFAAPYTLHAAALSRRFLGDIHQLSGGEWDEVKMALAEAEAQIRELLSEEASVEAGTGGEATETDRQAEEYVRTIGFQMGELTQELLMEKNARIADLSGEIEHLRGLLAEANEREQTTLYLLGQALRGPEPPLE